MLTSLFLLLSCKKSKDPCNDCSSNQICTAYFASATLKIQYANGAPYVLDSFRVVRHEDGKLLDPGSYLIPGSPANGIYAVFNDGFIGLTNQCGKQFDFIGYKGNAEVVREQYVFSHNCCHMQTLSGKTELIK